MDRAEKYAEWIVRNADKRGTPEFDTVAKAYQAAREQTSQQTVPVGNPTPSFGEMFKNEALASLPGGVLRGIKDVLDTGAYGLAKGYDKLTGADAPTLSSLVTGQKTGEAERVRQMNEAGKEEFKQAMESTGNTVLPTIGRIGGNIAITTPFLNAAGALATAANLPRLGAAISSGGMKTGGAVASGARNVAADLGIRAAGGSIGGGLAAGLVDPESAGTGAVIGGAIPLIAKPVGALGQAVGNFAGKFTEKGAKLRAGNALRDIGVTPSMAVDEVVIGSKPTLPQSLGTVEAARMEKALAARNPGFADQLRTIDAEQNLARWNTLGRVTGTLDDIAKAEVVRDAKAIPILESALKNAKKPDIESVIKYTKFVGSGPTRLRSNASTAINAVREKLAMSNSADDLYAVRKEIDDMLSGKVGSELKGTQFASKQLVQIKGKIDDVLNTATKGKFGKYLESYIELSKPINRMTEAQKFASRFEKATPDVFGLPTISPAQWRMAEGAPADMLGQKMSQGTKLRELLNIGDTGLLDDVALDLRRAEVARNLGAVRGGGSDTVQNIHDNTLLSILKHTPKPGSGSINAMLDFIANKSNQRPTAMLEQAFMDPKFAKALAAEAARRNAIGSSMTPLSLMGYRAMPLIPSNR